MRYFNMSILSAVALSTGLLLLGCTEKNNSSEHETAAQQHVVKAVAWDTKPYSSLLEYARDELKKQNITLDITYLTDSYTANQAVSDQEYDVNY